MVGRNGLCSGYKKPENERKSEGGEEKRQNRGVRWRETEPGKILVHQPATPRAVTTIVSVLEGEDRTEN
jgi:hypothetical protein